MPAAWRGRWVTVHSNYRELVTPADAERWFAAMPAPDAANILPMPARK